MLARRTSTTTLATIRLAVALALGGLVAAPSSASAQAPGRGVAPEVGGQTALAERQSLLAERQRVRADLERANAEIDALKRSARGLRDDYRLRARLADAEALARRLTALDARLGGGTLPSSSPWPAAGAEPRVLPTDGPAELEAKADILNDQARGLAARGDALLVRAHDLRARQTLRRRVGQMERDPFAPLEGSKRRLMASGSPITPVGNGPRDTTTVGGTGYTGGSETKAPASGDGPPGLTGGASAPTTPPTGSSSVNPTRPAPTPTTTGTTDGTALLSVQLRNLLDPTSLAELRRMEATNPGGSGYEALERAGAALKARADRMAQEAAALRARAR